MDQTHHDILDALDQLSSMEDHEFCEGFNKLVAQLERNFRLEEDWMDAVELPVFSTHQEQHARVLGALHNAQAHVMAGDIQLGREVVDRLLPHWLAFHASSMDATLALMMHMGQCASSFTVGSPATSHAPHP